MPGINSAAIRTETTIDAPPAKVREVMLNFDIISSLKTPFLAALAAYRANDREPIPDIDAQPSDIVKLTSSTSAVGESENVLFVNTPTKYGWKGGKGGLVAHHTFDFLPSPVGENKTLFKHEETFENGVAFMFWGFNKNFEKVIEGGNDGKL